MPISTSSFGDERDKKYTEYQSDDQFEAEEMAFPGLTIVEAETYLKRLGGGIEEKSRIVEGIGWKAELEEAEDGVKIIFRAHDELLDDLVRRFEEWVERGA
jgi:hypothetical protein